MSDDYKVPRLYDDQIREVAVRVRQSFGLPRTRPVNIIRCLQAGEVNSSTGLKKLEYIICPDAEMGPDDGRTEFDGRTVRVFIRQRVHRLAGYGDGRSRMTMAHELGHVVLHAGPAMHRRVAAIGATRLAQLHPSESAEHHAKVFASAFLVQDDEAAKLDCPERISEEFCVSLEAARICFDRLSRQTEKAASSKRVMKIAAEFRKISDRYSFDESKIYGSEPCPACKLFMLIPIGAKFLCDNCSAVSEQN